MFRKGGHKPKGSKYQYSRFLVDRYTLRPQSIVGSYIKEYVKPSSIYYTASLGAVPKMPENHPYLSF